MKFQKNSNIQVSILIVNFNSFGLLENCLNSVIKYTTNIDYEIIVIDNNSIEGDVREVTNKFSNIILIKNKQNKGFAAGNNIGAQVAKGKYLLLLNNDTELIENSIKRVFDFAELNKTDIIVGCKLLNDDRSVQDSTSDFPSFGNMLTEIFFLSKLFPRSRFANKSYLSFQNVNESTETDVVKGAFLFCKTQVFQKLDGFDDRFYFYSEETDFCYRFKKYLSGKVFYYPLTSVIHSSGINVNRNLWFVYKNLSIARLQYIQKHFSSIKFLFAIMLHYFGILLRIPLYALTGFFLLNKSFLSKSFKYLKLLFIYPQNTFKDP